MVLVVDEWASLASETVVAQVGPSKIECKHIKAVQFFEPIEFEHYLERASLVVAHAGMGSILTALTNGKPIIVMPRRANLGEHRNNHQLSTVERFESLPGLNVAWNEEDLHRLLVQYQMEPFKFNSSRIPVHAPDSFLTKLRAVIDDEGKT